MIQINKKPRLTELDGTVSNPNVKAAKIILTGDASGNDPQGNPVFNSTPRIDLSTSQVSNYDNTDPDLGGYSELIRLRAALAKSKPTISFYDFQNFPVGWWVCHFQPQDLLRYPTFADFPIIGTNNNLTGYFDVSTSRYYRYDGAGYVELIPTDERYWYMAIHKHMSAETADSTGYSNYTRFSVQYGYDVVAIDSTNAHFRIKDGTFKGVDFGAFIIDSGKTFSKNRFDFFPSANTATYLINRNTGDTQTIFNQNTQSFRVELLEVGNANNPTASAQIAIGTDNTTTNLIIPKNTIFPNHNVGIGMIPGARLDIRQNLGNANNTEYTLGRFSRDANSGFLQFGYRGNGTDLNHFLIRATNSKGVIIGTTANPTGFIFNNNGTLGMGAALQFTNGSQLNPETSTRTNLGFASIAGTSDEYYSYTDPLNAGNRVTVFGGAPTQGNIIFKHYNGTTFNDVFRVDTSVVDVYNKRIVNVATPTSGTDAANKNYVDNPAIGTATAGFAVTINARRGVFTTGTLTAVANSANATGLTINSTEIQAGDIVRWSYDNYSGTVGANGVPHIVPLTTTNGQATAQLRNIHSTNVLNGTIRVFFEVIKNQ